MRLDVEGNVAKEDLLNFAASLTPLFTAACIVTCGGLADRFGRMRFAFFGVVLSVIGSSTVAMSGNVETLVVGRALQGISLFTTSFSVFSRARRI